jgi:hypothetical protein
MVSQECISSGLKVLSRCSLGTPFVTSSCSAKLCYALNFSLIVAGLCCLNAPVNVIALECEGLYGIEIIRLDVVEYFFVFFLRR